MFDMGTWMDFEQALQSDPALQDGFTSVVEGLIRSGVQDEGELLRRGAEAMGVKLHGASHGEAAEALDDDALGHVAGGKSLQGDEAIRPFNFNGWLGELLRDLLKRNSAANAQNLLGKENPDAVVSTLPRPVSPEIGELKCL